MSIIDHESAAEETRRPGYRRRRLAGYDDGFELDLRLSHCGSGRGGAGPFDVLEGEVRYYERRDRIKPLQTLAIPTGAHHGFTVVGTKPAKLLVFFPVTDAFTDKHTTYL